MDGLAHDVAIGVDMDSGDVMRELAPVLEDIGKTDAASLEMTSEVENERDADSGFSGDVLAPMEEEDILAAVKKEIENAKTYHDELDNRLLRDYNAYHAIIDARYNVEGRSTIVSSDVLDTVEWVMPSIMRIFTASEDVVVLQPMGSEDVRPAELMQQLLNYQFTYKMDGFTKFYTWFKDAFVYGTGVVKLTWDTNYTRKSFFYDELSAHEFEELSNNKNISVEGFDEYDVIETTLDSSGMEVTSQSMVYKNVKGFVKRVNYSGPCIENIPLSCFYIEPGARTISEANFVAHRVKRTMDYLRRMQRDGVYHNVDQIVPNADGNSETSEYAKYAYMETSTLSIELEDRKLDSPGREEVWVWECYVKLDVNGDGLLEPLLVTLVGDTIVRIQENPFDHGEPPFEILVPIIDTHKFFGLSLTGLVSEFQRMKTALLRNVFDNMAFGVNRYFLVRRESGTDTRTLQNIRPGSVVMTDDPANSVREMAPAPLPPFLFQFLEYLDQMKEARVGVSRFQQGLDPKALSHTATGISSMLNASQQRLELIARLFGETGVKALFRKMISMNQQFIDLDFTVRLLDKEIQITPDALDGSFDLRVNVGTGAGLQDAKMGQFNQLLNIMPSLSELGLVSPQHVYNVILGILKAMGIKDVDSYVQPPKEGQAIPGAGEGAGGSPKGALMPQETMNGAPVVNPTNPANPM